MSVKIFFDMDGVLVDFAGGAAEALQAAAAPPEADPQNPHQPESHIALHSGSSGFPSLGDIVCVLFQQPWFVLG